MHIIHRISQDFKSWKGKDAEAIGEINSGSASNRSYFRLQFEKATFIATFNTDMRENEAFFYLHDFFKLRNVPLPELFYISRDKRVYFQQDLGDLNLLQKLKAEGLTEEVQKLYFLSLTELAQMQTNARQLNYHKCYPRASFDAQSVLWDLNYFKYYFLKVSGLLFDEQKLENDIRYLAQELAVKETENTFMFRDFQARNVQIYDEKPWFIDFQGGRRGPIAYDVASMLYQASANLPDDFRSDLKKHYHISVNQYLDYPLKKFEEDLNRMVFIRIIQTLGAYGFRGLIEGKEYFKNSIKPALVNLQSHMTNWEHSLKISYFSSLLMALFEIKDKFDN
jgi:aminoglycoside/choline kinase family phosphotransferase